MPAAVAKGIILSISIITALSLAVLENPQVQAWLEEQRQKLAELLRSIGEELDPQSRRAAEAFAFEGRTPASDSSLRREAEGSQEAVATATGVSLGVDTGSVRRIPVQGPVSPDEAEERRRKGREYLAKRNQQVQELQQRRKAARAEGAATPPTPTSFDAMVDAEGKLKLEDGEEALPSPPTAEPMLPEAVKAEMTEVESRLLQPLLAGEATSSSSGWQLGSQLANPFSDEYALERSMTPRPPVPPKVALDREAEETPALPGRFQSTPRPVEQGAQGVQGVENMSYEEQLAIALSLSESEAESASPAAPVQHNGMDEDDADLRAAIEASLRYMDHQPPQNIQTPPPAPMPQTGNHQLLVDLTPSDPSVPLHHPTPRGNWEALFDQSYSPTREPLSLAASSSARHEDEDDLYRVTPQLTRARLASLDAQHAALPSPVSLASGIPYDPVREAAALLAPQTNPNALEASFYSAADSAPVPANSSPNARTLSQQSSPSSEGQLIDISEDAPTILTPPSAAAAANGIGDLHDPATPAYSETSSFAFDDPLSADEESSSEMFASLPPTTPTSPRPRSAVAGEDAEVLNVQDVTDAEEDEHGGLLFDQSDDEDEEGDGILTPDSWTEVGSRDGESEAGGEEERMV